MKRLLYIAHRVPYPPDKGERVRAFHEIKALSERFDVTLAAVTHSRDDQAAAAPLGEYCQQLLLAPGGGKLGLARGVWTAMGGKSITEGYFNSRRLRAMIARAADDAAFDVVMAYCSSMAPLALSVAASGRVIDLVDVDSAKWAGYADGSPWPRSWLFRREAAAVAALEQRALASFDAVLLVSAAEAKALGAADGAVMPIVNGVDIEFFRPSAVEPADLGPAAVVFTGTMDYRPNAEAVCWFVREVFGDLKRRKPELTFTIVGRNPTAAVVRLGKTAGVTVTGSVPDVRPYLAGAAAAVCPLMIARGIQNKVLEAMAMGRAVVASPGAIEGLEVQVGTHLLQAETPKQWLKSLSDLLEDRQALARLGQAARTRVEERYTWASRMAPLVSLCERLCDGEHSVHEHHGRPT